MVVQAAASEAADKKADDNQDATALWAEMESEDRKGQQAQEEAETKAAEPNGHDQELPAAGDAPDMGAWKVEGDDESDDQPAGDDAAGEGETAAEAADRGAQTDDLWANATDAQRKAWQEAQDRLNAAEQYRRSNEGRIAAYQRQVAELEGLQQRQAEVASDPGATAKAKQDAAADVEDATKQLVDDFLDGDDFKNVREDFPEIDAAFRAFGQNITKTLEAKLQPFQALQQSVESDRQAQQQQAAIEHANSEAQMLTEAVPGWNEAVSKDISAWKEWLGQQPRHLQEAAARNWDTITDHREAADVIGRYMRETGSQQSAPATAGNRNTGPAADKRRRQLEGAAAVSSKLPAARPGIPEEGDAGQIWEAFKQRGL